MGKKKKKKKKKLLRLKELRKIEQAQKPNSISSIQEEELSEVNKETKKETNEPEVEVSRKEKKSEVLSENKLFKRDLRRAFIAIVICLVILVSLWLISRYTNYFSSFNILLQR